MAIKSLLLGVVAVIFISSLTSVDSVEFCDAAKIGGAECATCNFLTFGQEDIGLGFSYFCPNLKSDSDSKYCCYGPTRKPFCCNFALYIVSGLVWVFAVIVIIGAVAKLIKCLIF